MKLKICLLAISFLFLFIHTSHATRPNKCQALFDIHLGFNALKNIADYSLGTKPDLRKSKIIYQNFPRENESLKEAAAFIIDFAVRDNYPPLDSILSVRSNSNGKFLSWLSLCSNAVGEVGYRRLNKSLATVADYKNIYYETIIWEFPLYWDRNSIHDNFKTSASQFIQDYDSLLLKMQPQTTSELLLYNLFKLEIELEQSKNEKVFLTNLEALILRNKSYFSIKNYFSYIKEYFPSFVASSELSDKIMDGFENDRFAENPIYSAGSKEYSSLAAAMNGLKTNPFDLYLSSYQHVKKHIHKESYQSVVGLLAQLDSIRASCPKVCNVPAIGFDFTKNLLNANEQKYTGSQLYELKIQILKRWVDSHIACGIAIFFYMDQVLIDYWNSMSKADQIKLGSYIEKELERTNNHSYLLQLKKVLKTRD